MQTQKHVFFNNIRFLDLLYDCAVFLLREMLFMVICFLEKSIVKDLLIPFFNFTLLIKILNFFYRIQVRKIIIT